MARSRGSPLLKHRLEAQQLDRHAFGSPVELVSWLGALQAQDATAVNWAVGVRLAEGRTTHDSVEAALSEGALIRTHAFRGTWQLIAPNDLRWILDLVAPRLIKTAEIRYRQLELDDASFRKARAAITRALRSGEHLTRAQLASVLDTAGVSPAGQRLSHLLQRFEVEGLICSGARQGKQTTHALLELRVPPAPPLDREAALAELAVRYFQSRGPATLSDFSWWSGLTMPDARAGLDSIRSRLISEELDGNTYWCTADAPGSKRDREVYLLPTFDEYLIAYRDRSAALHPDHVPLINAGGGLIDASIAVDGRIVGTWRRTLKTRKVSIALDFFAPPERAVRAAAIRAAEEFSSFLGLAPEVDA